MPNISISLTEQEELLLASRELATSSSQLTTQLQGLIDKIPAVCKEGSLQSRLGELPLNHFTAKAQTFQALTELLFHHIQATYRGFIDTDKLLAADIVNAALVDPNLDSETRQALEQDPQKAFELTRDGLKKDQAAPDYKGPKSEEAILYSGQTSQGGAS